MSWVLKMFTSSIGQKLIMSITGLFLICFLVVHCFLNALIFINDGGALFNKGAEFMANNILIRIMEVVLFLGIILHIFRAYMLMIKNNQARPIKYAVENGNANSKWYSRSMGLLGTIILLFLIIHLKHFWVLSRFTDEITGGHETLYHEMKEVFSNIWFVIIYVLGVISLSYHLMHGFQSAFQTLGWNHKKYTPFVKWCGLWYSIIIPFIFAVMPIAMFFNFVK